MRFQLRLKHDEVRLVDALGVERERVDELNDLVRTAMLRTGCISKTVEFVAEECRNLNELILASMMIGYYLARPLILL